VEGDDVEVHIAVGLLDDGDGCFDLAQREWVEGVGELLDGSHGGGFLSVLFVPGVGKKGGFHASLFRMSTEE
jgi:hypothetical protein